VRAHAPPGGACKIHQRHGGGPQVVGVAQKLLYDFRAALAHAHGAQGAVAGVAVGAQYHGAAAGHHLTGILVDDGQVFRNVYAAVLPGGGQTEDVVVLVYGAAHGAQAVVAVGEYVGHRKFRQSGGPGGLYDAYVCDVMGDETVEAQLHHVSGTGIVGGKYAAGHCLCAAVQAAAGGGGHGAAGFPDYAFFIGLYHTLPSQFTDVTVPLWHIFDEISRPYALNVNQTCKTY